MKKKDFFNFSFHFFPLSLSLHFGSVVVDLDRPRPKFHKKKRLETEKVTQEVSQKSGNFAWKSPQERDQRTRIVDTKDECAQC